jgi:hypothetical protein
MSITHSEVQTIICSEVKAVSRQRLYGFQEFFDVGPKCLG